MLYFVILVISLIIITIIITIIIINRIIFINFGVSMIIIAPLRAVGVASPVKPRRAQVSTLLNQQLEPSHYHHHYHHHDRANKISQLQAQVYICILCCLVKFSECRWSTDISSCFIAHVNV